MWDPPRPGLEPVSPALAGRLPTTAPPGKPSSEYLNLRTICFLLGTKTSKSEKFLENNSDEEFTSLMGPCPQTLLESISQPYRAYPKSFVFVFWGDFFEFYFIYFLYGRFLLVIYFIHISVYMSIPTSQFIPPPPPPPPLSPLGVHTFVLYICVSISALQTGSSVPFF